MYEIDASNSHGGRRGSVCICSHKPSRCLYDSASICLRAPSSSFSNTTLPHFIPSCMIGPARALAGAASCDQCDHKCWGFRNPAPIIPEKAAAYSRRRDRAHESHSPQSRACVTASVKMLGWRVPNAEKSNGIYRRLRGGDELGSNFSPSPRIATPPKLAIENIMSWAPTYQQSLQHVYPYYRDEDEPLPSFASSGNFFSPSMSAMNTPATSFSSTLGNSTMSSFLGSDGHFYNFTDDNSYSQRSGSSEMSSSQPSSFCEEQSTAPSGIFKHAPSRYSSFANIYHSLAIPGPTQDLVPSHYAVALHQPVPVHHQDPIPQLAIVPSNHTPVKMDPFSYPLAHNGGIRTCNDLESESPTSLNPFINSSSFSSQSTGCFSFDSRTSSPLSMDSSLLSSPASSPHSEKHQQHDYTPQNTPVNTPCSTPLQTPSTSPHLEPQTWTGGPRTSDRTSHLSPTRKKSYLSTTPSDSAPSTAIRKPRRRPIASKLRPLLPLIPYPPATTPPPSSATYAQTIYQALMSTPTHRMDIRALYDYFRSQSPLGAFTGRGWQSSVRHNLSMNEDFIKTERQAGEKFDGRGFVWTLSERALLEGTVRATTGFRRGKGGEEVEAKAKRRKLKGKRNWGVVPEGPPPDVLPPNPPIQAGSVGGGGRFQEEWECMWTLQD